MSASEVKPKTRAFIAKYFKNLDLQDDDDIFAMGFVNSLFALQLVMFVEKEFHLKIEEEDLKITNFRSIAAMADLVERKTA